MKSLFPFVCASFLMLLAASLVEAVEPNPPFPFKAPFYVKDSVIYDQEGRAVKLWGVNYFAPFNHNFINIEEAGASHSATIDKDLDHFALMGIDFIRLHLYDREITDAKGNLIENDHVRVFDYLVDQAYKRGIFLMLTTTAWWNTVENEVRMRKGYAYWDLTQQPNFGFSNYFAKPAMLWHPQAIECQKTYLKALFNHRNVYSGKRLCEYDNIVAVELINEPAYIEEGHIDHQPAMGSDLWWDGPAPNHLQAKYADFAKSFPKETPRKELIASFRGHILSDYFKELFPIVDEHFGNRVIKTHWDHYSLDHPIADAFRDNNVEVVNIGPYMAPLGRFDGSNTDWANFLDMISSWLENHQRKNWFGRAKIIYEYEAVGSLEGYQMGAFAASFRRAGVQMAAFFVYTPSSVAEYNPGWLVEYLNWEHTPNKAAAFAAAGEIFRSEIPIDQLKRGSDQWIGPNFTVTRRPSNVDYYDGKIFRYAASTSRQIDDTSRLEIISGRGTSSVAESDGSGIYHLTKLDANHWYLRLFSNGKIVNDPAGAQTFRHMANRYMNINDIPVVSRLLDQPIRFRFAIGTVKHCEMKQGTRSPERSKDGQWVLYPGEYVLELE